MELNRIESLLEKYFQAETSIVEENELRTYFSSLNVAQHLEQYKPLFGFFTQAADQKFELEVQQPAYPNSREAGKKLNLAWLSIAASVVVLVGIGTYVYCNFENAASKQNLGTYDDPQVAFKQTQKALALLSTQVNVGIESVSYIDEYQQSKELIFKQ